MVGTYSVTSFSWTIANKTNPGQSFKVGDTLKITGADKLDGVAEVHLTFVDDDGVSHTTVVPAADFTVQTPTLIELVLIWLYFEWGSLPYEYHGDVGDDPVVLVAIGDGTIFSGSVSVGTFAVLDASASGIYKIVKDKTCDTLYSNFGTGTPKTIDVKIPDPFAKTGFIDGPA